MELTNILVTGGAGYVGSVLVPRLLEEGHNITVLDLMIYGEDVLLEHQNLRMVKGDIRDQELLKTLIPGHDAVIHLACISNDPSFELNPELGRSINLDAFRPLVKISADNGVRRFVYASSSSVYGVKKQENVHEDMILEPLTDYSRFKANCEDILQEYESSSFTTVILRPATVCGYAPRQRLDVVVNILTNYAFHKRNITVFGGEQLRPNIHIADMAESYSTILKASRELVTGETYNVGYENQSVNKLSKIVQDVVGNDVEIFRTETDDNRSYHISSVKIRERLGFKAKSGIRQAVVDLVKAFETGTLLNTFDDEKYFNIKRMQSLNLN